MSCKSLPHTIDGYIKMKVFDEVTTIDVPIGGVLPLFEVHGGDRLVDMSLFGVSATAGVLRTGLYTRNDLTEIIEEVFKDIDASSGSIANKTSMFPLVVANGIDGLSEFKTVRYLVYNKLTAAVFAKSDKSVTNPDTYWIGMKSSAVIPANTRISIILTYMGNV